MTPPNPTQAPATRLPSAPEPPLPLAPDPAWRMAEHWPELAAALTEQAVETADRLLRGLELLLQREKLSAAEFRVLGNPALRLRHCAKQAQQIQRLQSGQVRQSHEKIDLAQVVESALQDRREELAAQGITLRRSLQATELLLDPTLGYSLTQAMLDWGLRLGEQMELRLERTEAPARVRLLLKVHTETPPTPSLLLQNSIEWLLLRQLAATDGRIEVQRAAVADGAELSLGLRSASPGGPGPLLAAAPDQPAALKPQPPP